jgi:hypothetical protein
LFLSVPGMSRIIRCASNLMEECQKLFEVKCTVAEYLQTARR